MVDWKSSRTRTFKVFKTAGTQTFSALRGMLKNSQTVREDMGESPGVVVCPVGWVRWVRSNTDLKRLVGMPSLAEIRPDATKNL